MRYTNEFIKATREMIMEAALESGEWVEESDFQTDSETLELLDQIDKELLLEDLEERESELLEQYTMEELKGMTIAELEELL